MVVVRGRQEGMSIQVDLKSAIPVPCARAWHESCEIPV